jgi:hypothetical protein
MKIGDCFTLDTYGKEHLHIVVQEQRLGEDIGQVIYVYLSSVGNKKRIDRRTILHIGDHPFITEDSFVKYRNVLVGEKSEIEDKICNPYPPIKPEILEHIQSQFSTAHPYENIRKGIVELYNEWRENQIFNHPDF